MDTNDLKAFARRGIELEIARLQQALEELDENNSSTPNTGVTKSTRRRRPLTSAQKKALSKRMKAFWAAKRAAKK